MDALEMMPIRVKVAAILRKAIYGGEYRKGDELSLTDISQRLGVSRTPVREAFQALEAEGLITLRMNRGAVVNGVDRQFLRDAFEMRMLLEGEAAARAADRGMDAAPLLARAVALRDAIDAASHEVYADLNQEIHLAIWTAADNRRLKRMLLELWNGPSVGPGPEAAREHYRASAREHVEILSAIAAGDAAAARAAMDGHIRRSMENMLAAWPD